MNPSQLTNDMGQPIGQEVKNWSPRPLPPCSPMEGQLIRIEPFDIDAHAPALFEAYSTEKTGRNWTNLPYGPFKTLAEYSTHAVELMSGEDPFFHTIIGKADDKPLGVASLMRITPAYGTIEVGHISLSPALQQTPGSTEAMYLMARRVFDELGYRRYEWKCNALNAPSRRAATRLGFTYEGTFRKHLVVKGRNRDTAWYAMIDDDWPRIKANFEIWLSPDNFDADGRQIQSLNTLNGEGT